MPAQPPTPACSLAKRRARWLVTSVAALLLTAVLVESASAVPQWRQRRWLTRPPIDPTIRVNPRFTSSRQTYRAGGYSRYATTYRGRR